MLNTGPQRRTIVTVIISAANNINLIDHIRYIYINVVIRIQLLSTVLLRDAQVLQGYSIQAYCI